MVTYHWLFPVFQLAEMKPPVHSVLRLIMTASLLKVAVSVTTIQCDSLQQLCPNDDQPRMCVCNSTGAMLRWRSSVTGASLVLFDSNSMVGSTGSFGGGFSGNLTMNNSGFISTLTFNPSTVRSAGSGGVVAVLCDDLSSIAATADITVTSADVPGTRQLMIVNIGCDPTNTSYQTTLQWNANDTGGPGVSILYYLVEVTSPSGFMCLPEQCNVTANTTTITGLSCSTDYSFTVRAVNCIGSNIVSTPLNTSRVAIPAVEQACFVNDTIRVTLQDYNPGNGNCMAVNNFNITSSCTGDLVNTDYGPGDTMVYLPVPPSASCVVTVTAVADCGDSLPVTITTSGGCFPTSPPPTIPTMSMTNPSTSPSPTPLTITKACLIGNNIVSVQWMPPSSSGDSLCGRIQNYSLVISNSTGVLVIMTIESQTRSVSFSVTSSDYYNISLTGNSVCSGNLTTSVTTDIASTACVDEACTSCQVGLSVGIPVTFLLTAIISSLLTLLITQCLTMRGRSHSKFTPQQQQQGEPVYDPVSAVSGTRPTAAVEMKSNVAYGTTAAATAASGNITYETVLHPQ